MLDSRRVLTPPEPEKTENGRDGIRRAWAYSQMGLQLAVMVGLGLGGGIWADRHWGIPPWGLLAGLALGAGMGLTVFILDAMRMGREDDRDRTEEEEERKKLK